MGYLFGTMKLQQICNFLRKTQIPIVKYLHVSLHVSLPANPSSLLSSCIAIVPVKQDDCQTVRVLTKAKGPVHTNAFSKECVFVVIKNASMDWCPHYLFHAFLTVRTKTFENDRIARCDVSWTLCACYKHAPVYMTSSFSLGRFRASTLVRYVSFFNSFWSTFKSVFTSMSFRWKRSAN